MIFNNFNLLLWKEIKSSDDISILNNIIISIDVDISSVDVKYSVTSNLLFPCDSNFFSKFIKYFIKSYILGFLTILKIFIYSLVKNWSINWSFNHTLSYSLPLFNSFILNPSIRQNRDIIVSSSSSLILFNNLIFNLLSVIWNVYFSILLYGTLYKNNGEVFLRSILQSLLSSEDKFVVFSLFTNLILKSFLLHSVFSVVIDDLL